MYNSLFNSVDLFFHHKCLFSDEIGNGAIFTCAGLALYFYGIQTMFLCLTPTAKIAKVAVSQ